MTQNEETTEITVRPSYDVQLAEIENILLGSLAQHGLPTASILVPVKERAIVFRNVESVLEKVSYDQKQQSVYISKYLSAVSAGLFDAALNYLWDETISELRRRVAQYDLSYFYDNAVGNSDKRKDLKSEDDLDKIDDHALIQGARAIELISEIGFRHLEYIRYMRNWASAAHPNQNVLTGLQLSDWLQTCIIEVISLPFSNIVVEIGRFLTNVRTKTISPVDARNIAVFFTHLNQDQVNKLASGLFGIYSRADTLQQTRENIHNLIPFLWDRVGETTRQQFGTKYGKFVANNDQTESALARQFLEMVSGQSYMPDPIRAADIATAVESLLSAHRGMNNFYNEPAFARSLKRLVGQGQIPKQVNQVYTLGLVEVFLTNGHGVAVNAEPVYLSLLNQLNQNQALLAVLSFTHENIASRLQFPRCQEKFREVLSLMEPKVVPAVKELIADIEAYQGPLDRMKNDARIKRKVDNLQTILSL